MKKESVKKAVKKKAVRKKAVKKKAVSIVINTLNRCEYLKTLLESLYYIDYDNFEVVVVNGPSTDGTEELLLKWKDDIKIGICPEANLSASRNIGIAMAAGDFVAFIDDDAVPEPEWLNQAVDAFERESIAGVGGPVFDHTGYNYQCFYVCTDRLGHAKFQHSSPCPFNCFPSSYEFPHLAGCNAIFRRSALLEIGGFDEEYQYYLDETDVCLRLVDAGYELCQLSNSFVHHKYAPSNIREHKIPIYRYPILKNKIYFSNRYGRKFCTQNEIDNDIKIFIDQHRNEIRHGISENVLKDSHLREFDRHVKDALIQGKQAAEMPQKLITQNLLQSNILPFKHFQTVKCDGKPITIVFLCENNAHDPENEIKCIARDQAMELATLGHKVHVLAHGYDHNTVDFEHGIWVHRIVPAENVKSEKAEELDVPQDIWNQSKAFLDELDRISTHRSIDIVQAPITNLVGVAALESERYHIITSLGAIDVLSIKSGTGAGGDEVIDVDKALELIKLHIIKNSHGILTHNIETINAIDAFSESGDTHNKFISCAQNISGLIQDYKKILLDS